MDKDAFAGFDLFEGMTEAEVEHSASAFEPITRVAGERVTKENDFGYSFFIVVSGRLDVEVHDKKVAELTAGDYFGEVALVTGQKRNATVRATETCHLAKTMVWEFHELVESTPVLAGRIKNIVDARS